MADWGFPLSGQDLCYVVKSYLDKKGVKVTRFRDNLPKYKWVQSFLGRHKEFSLRKTNPIKRSRAAVSREDIREFFTNYLIASEGVPPENLMNCDETNFKDDPGLKKCITKKGTKYVEKLMNTSKQATSVMFCGSAKGELLPIMVVYKALNTYSSWCERGPANAVYAATKSGWFDGFMFEKWFFEILLPNLKRKVGKKLLVCDNLSSHISAAVVDACRENDIAFVCLPPNSTDKLQPLDVGVFGPLKAAWRAVLTEYKANHPNQVGVPKTDFPRLMKTLLERANPGQHLPAAFKKCGLYPVDVEKAVERIPHRNMECPASTKELLDSSFGEKLDQLTGFSKTAKPKRGKKIKVPAGKSYTDVQEEDCENEEAEEDDDDEEEEVPIRSRKSAHISESDSDEELPDPAEEAADDPGAGGSWRGGSTSSSFPVGCFVVAVYDKTWYLAQVEAEEPEEESEGYILLKYMERKGHNQFIWGKVCDTLKTVDKDILLRIEPPIPVSSRLWGLPKDVLKEVEKLFMVMWSIIFKKITFCFKLKIKLREFFFMKEPQVR
jgi:hypothetical protein